MTLQSTRSNKFPLLLMSILDEYDRESDIIKWLPHGRGFVICEKKRFEAEILPKYFKQSKYASFTRRLNRWRFVIQRHGHKKSSYFHPLFVKGDINRCRQMRPFPQHQAIHSKEERKNHEKNIADANIAMMMKSDASKRKHTSDLAYSQSSEKQQIGTNLLVSSNSLTSTGLSKGDLPKYSNYHEQDSHSPPLPAKMTPKGYAMNLDSSFTFPNDVIPFPSTIPGQGGESSSEQYSPHQLNLCMPQNQQQHHQNAIYFNRNESHFSNTNTNYFDDRRGNHAQEQMHQQAFYNSTNLQHHHLQSPFEQMSAQHLTNLFFLNAATHDQHYNGSNGNYANQQSYQEQHAPIIQQNANHHIDAMSTPTAVAMEMPSLSSFRRVPTLYNPNILSLPARRD